MLALLQLRRDWICFYHQKRSLYQLPCESTFFCAFRETHFGLFLFPCNKQLQESVSWRYLPYQGVVVLLLIIIRHSLDDNRDQSLAPRSIWITVVYQSITDFSLTRMLLELFKLGIDLFQGALSFSEIRCYLDNRYSYRTSLLHRSLVPQDHWIVSLRSEKIDRVRSTVVFAYKTHALRFASHVAWSVRWQFVRWEHAGIGCGRWPDSTDLCSST